MPGRWSDALPIGEILESKGDAIERSPFSAGKIRLTFSLFLCFVLTFNAGRHMYSFLQVHDSGTQNWSADCMNGFLPMGAVSMSHPTIQTQHNSSLFSSRKQSVDCLATRLPYRSSQNVSLSPHHVVGFLPGHHYGNVSNSTAPIISADSASSLPSWLREYAQWHNDQRQQWNETSFRSMRYLIMTCASGEKCGGASDRLRPVLALLRLAANTNRILLIYWERPAPLEEFLVPPVGGLLDWRVPNWLCRKLRLSKKSKFAAGNLRGIVTLAHGCSRVTPTQLQSSSYGANFYNQNISSAATTINFEDPPMDEVFSASWHLLFTPSPAVSQRIKTQLAINGLQPGHYISIHLRTYKDEQQHVNNATTRKTHQQEAMDALACGTQMQPGGPLFFASDFLRATNFAVQYGMSRKTRVVALSSNNHNSSSQRRRHQPMHLGLSNNSDATAFYDIFVDLYLLSLGRCVLFGSGGFGQWARLLSANPSCGHQHGKRGRKCAWKDPAFDDGAGYN
jgi:hypothetical protein